MRESVYQTKLIKKLERMLPGCYILKNDPRYFQGIPDIIVLWRQYWAMFEVKIDFGVNEQPNQDYHIRKLNEMSFAAFINPHNEEAVLDELQSAFGIKR